MTDSLRASEPLDDLDRERADRRDERARVEAPPESWQLRYGISRELEQGLRRYRDQRVRPGSFLLAVLQNDLTNAALHADLENRLNLDQIVRCCIVELPYQSWGSREAVAQWLEERAAE